MCLCVCVHVCVRVCGCGCVSVLMSTRSDEVSDGVSAHHKPSCDHTSEDNLATLDEVSL